MFEKQVHSLTVTPDDQELARQYGKHAVGAIAPELTDDDIAAAIANSGPITHDGQSTIRVIPQEPPRSLQVGRDNPAAYEMETRREALANRCEFHLERLRELTDPRTGNAMAGYEREWNIHAMNIRQLQFAHEYDAALMEAQRRTYGDAREQGLSELQAEADWQARRTQDATAKKFNELFGPVRIV